MKGEKNMKDFNDFRKYINENCLDEIHSKILADMDKAEGNIDFENESQLCFWKIQSYCTRASMMYLEKYHEWLNS
jgi:hypothetical protein